MLIFLFNIFIHYFFDTINLHKTKNGYSLRCRETTEIESFAVDLCIGAAAATLISPTTNTISA